MTFPVSEGFKNTVRRNLVIGGTGNGTGFFEYNGTPAAGNPPVAYAAPPGVTKDPFGNTLPATSGGFTSVNGSSFAELSGVNLNFHNPGNTIDQVVGAGGAGAQLVLDSGATAASPVQAQVLLIPGASVPQVQVTGNVDVSTAGTGLRVAEGVNAKQGTATLVGGTKTVANTSVTLNSKIDHWRQVAGGTLGHLSIGTIVAGVSFVINSTSNLDTSTIGFQIFEPG